MENNYKINYKFSELYNDKIIIIKINNVINYNWGGDDEEDDFFIELDKNCIFKKGYILNINNKKYIITKILSLYVDTKLQSFYDLEINCNYSLIISQ